MVRDYTSESLSHDPIHGYIPFTSRAGLPADEVAEQDIIDHPWVQRLRHIHQLQTAWWVFPSAEHMRFQHVLGSMHLASVVINEWYDSLREACPNVPSKAYVESLVRLAALLHDVGHGPFGHFFDEQYLSQFGITHEDVGAAIIEHELGELLRRIRRNPNGKLRPLEEIEPRQIAWLIRRPRSSPPPTGSSHRTLFDEHQPDWLHKLRALFCGIYTVDNMDFVLRDAYMSGYSQRAFDLWRLVHYSFFTPSGLTIHIRGLPTLIHFIEARANLFRTVYFHRTVRALDLALEELFAETMRHLFPGNPLDHLDQYLRLTESSLLVDVQRWETDSNPERRELGRRWRDVLCRKVGWKMACERTVHFHPGMNEQTTIFSEPRLVEQRVRRHLPPHLQDIPLRVDVARHYHRPAGHLPTAGMNYVLDPVEGTPRPLDDFELFRSLPTSFSIVRIYARSHDFDAELTAALNAVLAASGDTRTNM